MSGSAILQLKAKGKQDIYLTENPDISFFNYKYKKHSNFSIEAINLSFANNVMKFNEDNRIKIVRNADLISKIYLNITLKAQSTTKRWGWVENIGNNLINYIEFTIGGNLIDKIYGSWLNIWHELNVKPGLEKTYNKIIGNNYYSTKICSDINPRDITLFIPLNFFFNKYSGLALPLIALQNHEVELNFNLKKYNDCINSDNSLEFSDWNIIPNITNASILVDYIYLDNEERTIFAKSSHEILIEQLNYDKIILNTNNSNYNSIIKVNNPVKIIFWNIILNKYIDYKKNLFLDNNIVNATIRFILLTICSTDKTDKDINIDIEPGSIFKVNSDNSITTYNKNGIITDIGTKTILNNNYKFYTEIVNILENCIINKKIKKSSTDILSVNYNYIKVNKVLDNYTYSLPIKDIITNSDNDMYPFKILYRSKICGGIGLAKYDLKLINYNNYGLYLDKKINPILKFKFMLDNNDKIEYFDNNYFNYLQPYLYNYNIPSDGLNMYSLSLYPKNYQPSGAINMSGVNNIELLYNLNNEINSKNTGVLHVYMLKYNIVNIIAGKGGIRFA